MTSIPGRSLPVLVCAQPEAQLAALGAQWLLPRPRPAPLNNQWVAIWASTGLSRIFELAGDCEGNHEGDWFYGYVGAYQASCCLRTGDEGRKGDTQLVKADTEAPGPEYDGPMPRGAIVGVAWLVGSAPVGGQYDFSTGLIEGKCPAFDEDPVLVIHDDRAAVLDWPHGPNQIVSDQLAYTSMANSRWVWILRDARLLDQPVYQVRPRGRKLWIWEPPADLLLPVMKDMS